MIACSEPEPSWSIQPMDQLAPPPIDATRSGRDAMVILDDVLRLGQPFTMSTPSQTGRSGLFASRVGTQRGASSPCFETASGGEYCVDLLPPVIQRGVTTDWTFELTVPPNVSPGPIWLEVVRIDNSTGRVIAYSYPVVQTFIDSGANIDDDGYCEATSCRDLGVQPGDCDDGNANVFPNQTAWFGDPRLNGAFDYHCDGIEEPYEGPLVYK
jgi:hypothetical protein